MNEMTRRFAHLAAALAVAALAACGGGDAKDDDGAGNGNGGGGVGGGSQTATCDTTLFQAGAVQAPTATQLAAYAGTFAGQEGNYGPNPGDPFVSTGNATVVLGTDGALTYRGNPLSVTSICMDKAAGPFGTLLYVHTADAHFDISDQVNPVDLGQAWGIAPGGTVLFRNGLKP